MRSNHTMMVIVAGVNACFWIGSPAPANGRTIVVDWHGTGEYTTIQAALDASVGGDTIIVLPSTGSPAGAYVGNIVFPARAVTLRSFNPQDPAIVASTVLDANQAGRVVTFAEGVSAETRLDGFTIRNGDTSVSGGGVYCNSCSPTIANCTITENDASTDGGGIYCGSSSSPTIINCTITENNHGGIYCSSSSPTITNCTITGNVASVNGGGVYCSSSSPTIANCTIVENIAPSGAGVYCGSSSSPMIANCTITGNVASVNGGGVYCSSSSPSIANCAIMENSASGGGGVYCSSSSPTIANCTFLANSASGGGGIACIASSPTIINCTIAGNTGSSSGGGVVCFAASPTIANSLVAFNSSGIYKSGPGTLFLTHNCVYGNTDYNFAGISDPTTTHGNISADPLFRSAGPGPDTTWGTADDVLDDLRLQIGSACIDAGNNADVPADLTDLDVDGDTGEPLPFDLASRARFFDDPATADTGAGTPPIVDMGAYEYFPTAKADFDADGDVDGDDLAVFESCATGPAVPYNPAELPEPEPGCTLAPDTNGHIAADFDEDDDVDQSDFGAFQRCYSGEGNPAEAHRGN